MTTIDIHRPCQGYSLCVSQPNQQPQQSKEDIWKAPTEGSVELFDSLRKFYLSSAQDEDDLPFIQYRVGGD
jgi:hypothetical protein